MMLDAQRESYGDGLDQTLLALILVYSGGAAMNYYIAKDVYKRQWAR